MRGMMVFLGALLMAAGLASAATTDLGGGVFIAHHPPGLQYSEGEDWCQRYVNEFAISECKEQHNRIDLDGNLGESSLWYVLAAWTEDKEWCGTEFGFGQFDPYIYGFAEWGPCSPAGALEIPTESWPGPSAGTAVVVTDAPWSGNFLAVYYFAGYAYSEGIIPLGIDPATDFGGTGNCAMPPEDWSAAAFGGMGLSTDGIYACPGPGGFGPEGQDVAACCLEESCLLATAQECERIGGEFHPGWESCDPNPCSGGFGPEGGKTAVCCVGDGCTITTLQECTQFDGEWFPDWHSCDPNPCNLVCWDGSGRWETIQEAINAADDGWVLELCDGAFDGEQNRNIVFGGKALTLRSRSGNPENCEIDCQDVEYSHGFLLEGEEDTPGPLIAGITVRRCPAGDPNGI
jgi:hypothetical protein